MCVGSVGKGVLQTSFVETPRTPGEKVSPQNFHLPVTLLMSGREMFTRVPMLVMSRDEKKS